MISAGALAALAAAAQEPTERGQGIPPWALMLLVLIGGFAALRFLRRGMHVQRDSGRAARGAAAGAMPKGAPAIGGSSQAGQDAQVSKLYVELHEFAREMEGRMDTKIAYLRRLIADAEKVLTALEGSVARGEAVLRGEPPPPVGASEPLPPAAPEPRAPEPRAPDPKAAGESPPPAVVDVLIGGGEQELEKRILSLQAAGKAKEAIADELGIPKGEVELVLSLHRVREKSRSK